jgi:hypothetical protein
MVTKALQLRALRGGGLKTVVESIRMKWKQVEHTLRKGEG